MVTKDAQFPTTRWSVVLAAGGRESGRPALDWLCERYWYPLYAFIRRRGYGPAEAQDLTQAFLVSLLERRSFESADPERGRFRSYLVGALKHFLSDRQDYERAAMRGGGQVIVPMNFGEGEEKYLRTPEHLSPEALYERQWALAMLDRVVGLLRAEHVSAGKGPVFERLKAFLAGDDDYRLAAVALGMQEGAVRVAVHRLRRRYRDLISAEITETVRDGGDVQSEIRHLIEVAAL